MYIGTHSWRLLPQVPVCALALQFGATAGRMGERWEKRASIHPQHDMYTARAEVHVHVQCTCVFVCLTRAALHRDVWAVHPCADIYGGRRCPLAGQQVGAQHNVHVYNMYMCVYDVTYVQQ